eukprot:Lithocolla_globosa_v1_NODE_937_length_3060_cov_153.551747.p2 type:complete len:293 gc:universal NODE_937_length_3060_cov_153.551747:966-88(-)
MALYFFQDIFPASHSLAQTYLPSAVEFLFPQALQLECKQKISMDVFVMTVTQPILLFTAFVGAIIGFSGFIVFFIQRRDGKGLFFWAFAFLFFGCMNTDAIFAHCLLYRVSPSWDWLVLMDIAFTSCSSFCLGLAALVDFGLFNDRSVGLLRALIFFYFFFCVLCCWYSHFHSFPFYAEVFYFGVTILAAVLLVATKIGWHVWENTKIEGATGMLLACLGASVFVQAPMLDRILTSVVGCMLNMTVLIFWGCDLCFLGFYLHLEAKIKRRNTKNSKTNKKQRNWKNKKEKTQ